MIHRAAILALALTLFATALACDDAGEGALDPDIAAGCARFGQGAETALLAFATPEDALETVSAAGQRYAVTFDDTARDHEGYLLFSPVNTGRYLLLLAEDLPLTLTDLAANEVAPARIERQSPACPKAGVIYTFDLEPSVYTLKLGPTDAPDATLVVQVGG